MQFTVLGGCCFFKQQVVSSLGLEFTANWLEKEQGDKEWESSP